MIELHRFDAEESELREVEPKRERVLTIALLIFSLGFCALVFSAGWKEVSAYERCGLNGVLTAGRACSASR
jgi:hypothetical protein